MYGKKDCEKWWESLSLKEKQYYKKQYEIKVYDKNNERKQPFPSLLYTHNTRISKLTGNQKYVIFRFHFSIDSKHIN